MALFYADDGMVAFSDPVWLRGAFNALVGLFDRVGLQTNAGKTVGMVCRPCQAVGTQLEAAYIWGMTGKRPSYQERKKGQEQYRDCGEDLADGSLTGHMETQHGRVELEIWIWKNASTGKNHGRSAWPFWPREAHGTAQWRDYQDERRRGRRCGYIFCTGISWTPYLFWRR